MTLFWFLLFGANVLTVLFFSADTDVRSWKDVVMLIACCFLPIIPIGYLYNWCNRFVRGEI